MCITDHAQNHHQRAELSGKCRYGGGRKKRMRRFEEPSRSGPTVNHCPCGAPYG
ncbi:hypothetical protein AB0890_25895 [Streptomyces sp. NPDC005406]|uniref:hypothetical protein n=1 Tax=Streptomyces sp. NPDC005406 TaxID=3155339 RepID=UPI0034518AB5